jgi:DNA mismatch repair ATPase MutS
MKVLLIHKDHDFNVRRKLPSNEQALTQDLELETLFNAMALGDPFLFEVVKTMVLSSLENDVGTIRYRQNILKDCLKEPSVAREIYNIALEAIEKEREYYLGILGRHPGWTLHRSTDVLQMFVVMLKKLREIADRYAEKFESEGFAALFTMIQKELSPEYFVRVEDHLRELQFRAGVLISAELGKANKGSNYMLRRTNDQDRRWMTRLFAQRPPAYTFNIHPCDVSGAQALSELKDRGINLVANVLAQSNDHILNFLVMLRTELAFYLGCLNLHGRLSQKLEPTCFPTPAPPGDRRLSFLGLYDVCLTLSQEQRVVGNKVDADNKDIVIITGANQGGKSTFLRSVGLSQLMMQAGMFVPAESFCSELCDGLFSHYKREEDTTMTSGKLDEELSRMSDIVDNVTPNAMLLFNESFAATNEREGSEIASQITRALVEKHIRIVFVTHLYEFAQRFQNQKMKNALFLRAERQVDGGRTFNMVEGEPLQTSYGEDLYRSVFEKSVPMEAMS